jgi:glycosyltransferase involved in cell wall biosynthesis
MVASAEVERIGRALESVAGWAREIVLILNVEVTDGTDRVAEAAGAKVFREPWRGHIAQRNALLAKATQPWLISLDADETIPPALWEEIERAIATAPPEVAAFECARCTYFCGRWIRHGDWYPDRVCRLWRRDRARWGGTDPHSRLIPDGRVERLRGELLHYTGESLAHMLVKTLTYADEFAVQCAAKGRRVGVGDVLLRPIWRFVRCYLLRLGLLDGWQGALVAGLGGTYTFCRYARALESQRRRAAAP